AKYPRQLSGGQQQRVGVARALGADPPIMLMDEPFGAVDPITRETLQDEFLQIQQEIGKTIIFVTHDIDEAIKMGDRVAVMREGKLVQFDAPDDLLANPKDAFVRDFVGADRQLKRLGLVRVHEIMDRDPPVVKEDGTLDEALALMNRQELASAFVVDRQGKLKGWVSAEMLAATATLPAAVQRAPLRETAAREGATLREALSVMLSSGFGATPVVDEEGRLVGSVTLEALKEHAEGNGSMSPEEQAT
ncbi:MAG TPA: CBS domain-containing protein, partial [Trueperaceae bacterium]|nr:CBS domain-containing protein [Trueperaceae bacterium]